MLKGYKTYVFAGLTIASAIASWYFGDLASPDAAKLIVDAVLAATLRSGIANATSFLR